MSRTVHIIGAGISGLACAVQAIRNGQSVTLYEATQRAGGRCRSFYDTGVDTTLDNGSHVVLAGNPRVFEYLSIIGASNELVPANDSGRIDFADRETLQRWDIKPNTGRFPWFLFSSTRRPPNTALIDFATGLNLFRGSTAKSVANVLSGSGNAWTTFWEPFSTAVMNTHPTRASAQLLGTALKRGLTAKNGGLRAYVPRTSLNETFIEPALKYLRAADAKVEFRSLLRDISGDHRATHLSFRSDEIEIGPEDIVVLATPPWSSVVEPFLPKGFSAEPSPIVNAHFTGLPEVKGAANKMIGVINGVAHWVFVQNGVISVTVSADEDLAGQSQGDIAQKLWADVRYCLDGLDRDCPVHRVIVERRATPVQDAAFAAMRPSTVTKLSNVFLAGDWIDTGLPCTLESAVLSGFEAANAALSQS